VINYFIGKTKPWLQQELANAQEELAAGNTVMRAVTGETDTTAQVQVNIRNRIEHLLWALNQIDPATYPITSIRRVTQTQIQVYGES